MTIRRLSRKPNRFSRNSKRRGVLKRFKLQGGGPKDDEIKKLSDFGIEFANLRKESKIIEIKAQIARALQSGGSDQKATYDTYLTALDKLINDTLEVAETKFSDDGQFKVLQTQVASLRDVLSQDDDNKYYDLRDIYDVISEFFTNKLRDLYK
jgi:hypothetical protein